MIWIVLLLVAVLLWKLISMMNKESRIDRNSPVERMLRGDDNHD